MHRTVRPVEFDPDEIIEDVRIICGEEFRRYYHENQIPTRYLASQSGHIYSEISEDFLSYGSNPSGYHHVLMYFRSNERHTVPVHKVIATVWCGGWKNGLVVDHLDGNPKNNRADNLEWVTYSENTKRAYDKGQKPKLYGETNGSNKYSDDLIHKACKMLEGGISCPKVAKELNINLSTVQNLLQGARPNITSQYKFPDSLVRGPKHPLTESAKEWARELYAKGTPLKQIPDIIGEGTYNQIVHAVYDPRYKK